MKLLLMALVIAGAALVIRNRRPPGQVAGAAPPPLAAGRSQLPRIAAWSALLVMLAGSGLFLYQQWRDAYQVITLRVVDSRSGQQTTYRAYRGDIDGRSFRTLDGRTVTLAEVERLEQQAVK